MTRMGRGGQGAESSREEWRRAARQAPFAANPTARSRISGGDVLASRASFAAGGRASTTVRAECKGRRAALNALRRRITIAIVDEEGVELERLVA
jgi:hypothetical protein